MEQEKIKSIISDILERMDINHEPIEVRTDETGRMMCFIVKTDDSGLLIGNGGGTLNAFNLILKKIAAKNIHGDENYEEATKFYVDINNYQEKLLAELKTRAGIMAERARSFGVDVPLPPMSSYERMLIHTMFQGVGDLKTESEGVGRERRIVIKYVGKTSA
ncbi:MAG: R3H domain-containing nucleic acid-binding protein [bacterium]|nr:R3H domain-containing nucleic acid-binding protein [bacterium]